MFAEDFCEHNPIQQAKAEVRQEMEALLNAKDDYYRLRIGQIFEEIEKHWAGVMIQDKDTWWHGITDKDWEAIKSKYGGQKK
jgi:hypothetical protein